MMSYKEWLEKEGKEEGKLTRLEYEAKMGNEKAFDDYAKVLSGEKKLEDVILEFESSFGDIVEMFIAMAKVFNFKVKDINNFRKTVSELNEDGAELFVEACMETFGSHLFSAVKTAFKGATIISKMETLKEVMKDDK